MTIARSVGFLIGSSKTAGVPLPAGGTFYGGSKDVLGDNTSTGKINLYISLGAGATPNSVQLKVLLDLQPDTGTGFGNPVAVPVSLGAMTGTQRAFLGRFEIGRYVAATISSNCDNALTNVALEYELEKTS